MTDPGPETGGGAGAGAHSSVSGSQEFTDDAFLGGRLTLRQPAQGFRAGFDSVILAASVCASPGEVLFEPGMGAGAASLCAAHRLPGLRIVGVEIDSQALALARANIAANGLTDRVTALAGDIRALPAEVARARFDHAMVNPPFQGQGTGTAPPDARKARAHVEEADLDLWLNTVVKRLKPGGRLSLIHRADRLDRILAVLTGRIGGVVVHPLWPKAGRPARRVLLTGRRGMKTPLTISPGLVLHGDDGEAAPLVQAMTRDGAPFPDLLKEPPTALS